MNVWSNLLFVLQVLSAITMIGLVLIQHGKGADMGASFGSGASGSLFGATGSANFLSRSTAICATVFFVTTLGLAGMATGRFASHNTIDVPAAHLDSALAPAVVASAPVVASSAAVLVPATVASAAASAAAAAPASAAASTSTH